MRRILLAIVLIVGGSGSLAAHDLFLKPLRYFLEPGDKASVRVLNGTFTKSESAVAKNRLRDLSVVTSDGVQHPDTSSWTDGGDTSVFSVPTRNSGTYLVGASTHPRTIRLDGKQFNEYLKSDGVPDVLEARHHAGALDTPAHERYSKHVKTVLQVGEARTPGFETVLGYPAELVPLDNPYSLKVGSTLRVRALVDGKAVANQFVVSGGRTLAGDRLPVRNVRSDAEGIARIAIPLRGYWYIKFIHMIPVTGDSVNYESKWATLTFQVR